MALPDPGCPVTTLPIPLPRRPVHDRDPVRRRVREWYENELGWGEVFEQGEHGQRKHGEQGPEGQGEQGEQAGRRATEWLLTGLRFDALELPAGAGFAVLRRLRPGCPVALRGERMRLLVAAGSADEVPGLLDWLEWGTLPLDLASIGAGGRIEAPLPPGPSGSQGAAVWLRPPEPGCEVEPTLPALPSLGALGGGVAATRDRSGTGPDLVRLVDTAATECHRFRLFSARAQRWASSYA